MHLKKVGVRIAIHTFNDASIEKGGKWNLTIPESLIKATVFQLDNLKTRLLTSKSLE